MAPTPQEHQSNECDSSLSGERVVISGISGIYPSARNVKELSNILYDKKNPIHDENMRWNYNHPELCNKTGKAPGLNRFDAQFFKVHWRQSNNMDAMSRKLLEQSFQAIYDAGLSPDYLSGKKVGVYVGSCFSETEKSCFYVATSRTGFGIAGCNKAMFANRISYWLNVKGPSMAIDQACCSSLAALELAYLAVQKGECEAAIVGGASLNLHPQSSVHISRIMKLSADGKTKSFDQDADGCAKSEAVNVLFLQKAKHALRVYADVVYVKSEFASLLDGELGPRYGFYRDPVKMGNFLKSFYEQAGIPPHIIEYVEAYGSAVPEVDKVELEAIDHVFCSNRTDSLPVGSVMSNIGYAEAASGISAITKVLLGYHRGELAGNLHFKTPRQDILALREGKIRILDDHQSFRRTYAAINAMSVTGVNAHVLLNGRYKPKDLNKYKSSIPYLVTISGRQEASVTRIYNDLKTRPIDAEEIALLHKIHEIKISGHMSRGFAILNAKDNETVTLYEKAGYYDDVRRPLWFVYSGMGSQWPGMGTQLMRIPIFAAAIERCQKALEPKGIDLINIITSTDKTIFDNILHSFVGIAAVQIGLTDILKELGLVPDNIIGHSVGELGCAYADGCLTAEEMILSAYSRGLVSLQTPFIRGSMAAVGMGYEQIKNICPDAIEVACHNGPESCTISGPADAMCEFVAHLTAKGVFAKEVPCSNIAYHSRYIAEAGPGLLKYLKEVIKTPRLRSERWVSTSVPSNKWQQQSAQYSSAEYHTNNLLSPVLFEETSRLIPSNAVLVEIAPHGLLQAILKRSLPESCRHIPLTRRGHPDNTYLVLEAVGKMFMEGWTPKLCELYPKVEFPVSTGTPMLSHLIEWDHRELWPVPFYAAANRRVAAACNHIITLHDDEHAYLRGHVIRNKTLYPFAGALVATWDTLAMFLNIPKKQLPVVFRDVHFYSQPIMHNQRQLNLTVQLQRGTGYFEVMESHSRVASGYVIERLQPMKNPKVFSEIKLFGNTLSNQDIYDLLRVRDYNYSGEFRSIYSADASLFEAVVEWKDNWVTLIDGLLQLHVLHRAHDSVSQLTRVGRLYIDVNTSTQEDAVCIDGRNMMKINVSEDLHYTRCGGILIEQLVFTDLLPETFEDLKLEGLIVSDFNLDNNKCMHACVYIYNASTICNKKIVKIIYGQNIIYTENLFNSSNINLKNRKRFPKRSNNMYKFPIINKRALGLRGTTKEYIVLKKTTIASLEDLPLRWRSIPSRFCPLYGGAVERKPRSGRDVCSTIGNLIVTDFARFIELRTSALRLDLLSSIIFVPIHYAGINDADVKVAAGINPVIKGFHSGYGMDFSGITESGQRVMGLVRGGAASSRVRTPASLLWPVPDPWTLEEAATVPLAYLQAMFCLTHNLSNKKSRSVLVLGGAGAMGQASIRVALAFGYKVFTTVSNASKNKFLRKLFPQLEDDNIGCSRNHSFSHMVLNRTNGRGCTVVITCAKGALKNVSLQCCAPGGVVFDLVQVPSREIYSLPMGLLTKDRSYLAVDIASLLDDPNSEIMKYLHSAISSGIASGFVCPLSRICFSPTEVSRAFRLVAASGHRGRVLIKLCESQPLEQLRISCSTSACHILLCNRDIIGIQFVERLISRGVRNLRMIYYSYIQIPGYIHNKKRSWEKLGVQVDVSTQNIYTSDYANNIFNDISDSKPVEGIYVIATDVNESNAKGYNALLNNLDAISRKTCPYLKHFAIVCDNQDIGQQTYLTRVKDQLPVSLVYLSKSSNITYSTGAHISSRSAVDAIENALLSKSTAAIAKSYSIPRVPLLERLTSITDINIFKGVTDDVCLEDLSNNATNVAAISALLRDYYGVSLTEEHTLNLSLKEIERTSTELEYEEVKGLEVFYSTVDSDEMVATTDLVLLPTLANNIVVRDDEFDVKQKYLYIIPGMEGHHEKFRNICERFKIAALVLQPGLDRPQETIQELAQRFAKIIVEKTEVKDNFYLLGYENGVAVALEIAAILENSGYTGTVFCVGCLPEEFKSIIEEQLDEYKTEEQLQDAVLRHMYGLMTKGNCSFVEEILESMSSWGDKVEACVRALLGQVSHSAQYARALIEAAYARILRAGEYEWRLKPLRSRLVLLRAGIPTNPGTDPAPLSSYTLQTPLQYQLSAPLSLVLNDLRCASIINRHLDPTIIEEFKNKNLCETYLLNNDTFMNTDINTD
ncbi:hypothetical protein K1T71_011145 [Dendrolimus kikuchii]|uniref:Uncharacterized protein n=1 Tax=Dendrolimus kikuchii TaxID=765133 RepID=A0ACC1CMX8_9NEOP|nr:hypothetical protein K1T71_011145 [Dendrolimus kikuchii]